MRMSVPLLQFAPIPFEGSRRETRRLNPHVDHMRHRAAYSMALRNETNTDRRAVLEYLLLVTTKPAEPDLGLLAEASYYRPTIDAWLVECNKGPAVDYKPLADAIRWGMDRINEMQGYA